MVKNVLKKAVVIIFLIVISIIIVDGPLCSVSENTSALFLVFPVAAGIALLLWAKKMFCRHEDKLEKRFDQVFVIYLALMFVLQIASVGTLRFSPKWDLDAVYGGAISWINNGDLHEYNDYFLWFPNNFGLLTIYKFVFSIFHGIFGEKTDYFLIASTMGCISLTVTRYSVVKICKKLFGTVSAYMAMLVMMLCPVMYFMSAAFYTDVLSLWAAPLTVLLFMKAHEMKDIKKKTLIYAAAAVTAAFGAEIKFTVLIIVIALGISLLINGEFRELGYFALTQVAVFVIVFTGFNDLYDKNFDTEKAKLMNTPLTHWLMMGASENGSYNGADYDFTRSFTTVEERDKAVREELIKRYKDYGLSGSVKLWKKKVRKDFGDGTLGISDFLDDDVVEMSSLHDWLLYDGEHYAVWFAICGEYFIILLLTSLISVREILKKKKLTDMQERITLSVYLSITGVWILLLFWEASARYFSNFYGMIILGSVIGLSMLNADKEEKAEETAAAS